MQWSVDFTSHHLLHTDNIVYKLFIHGCSGQWTSLHITYCIQTTLFISYLYLDAVVSGLHFTSPTAYRHHCLYVIYTWMQWSVDFTSHHLLHIDNIVYKLFILGCSGQWTSLHITYCIQTTLFISYLYLNTVVSGLHFTSPTAYRQHCL